MDLTWTKVWQKEDPKFARWQLFRQIFSKQQQTFTTTCSMPLVGETLLLFPPCIPLCHGSTSEQHFLPCHLQFYQMIQFGAIKKKKKKKRSKTKPSIKPTKPNTEPTQTRRKQVFLTMDSHRHEGHLWQGRHKCPAQF